MNCSLDYILILFLILLLTKSVEFHKNIDNFETILRCLTLKKIITIDCFYFILVI